MAAAPLKAVQGVGGHKPHSVQKRASVHHKTVSAVSEQQEGKRVRRGRNTGKSSAVTTRQKHPALMLARELGVPEEHVQIIEEGRFWSAVLWNHPAPWPGVQR